MTTKVVFCWSDISGYMAACWRALHSLPDIDLFVVAFQARTETAFSAQLMAGLPCRLLDLQERDDPALIEQIVAAQQPDVVVLCGWFHKPYRQLPANPRLRHVRFVMGMDTPWQGTARQFLAPYALDSFLKRMDATVVAGERSWQYARRLGVPSRKIVRGLYGVDAATWSPLLAQRRRRPWPRSFLFVGRYVEAKGIETMVAAYQQYWKDVIDPWPLICCGQGPMASFLREVPGLQDRGFVQPQDLHSLFLNAGAFLLPSRFDPWPLALVEAAASGLPLVCTDACGSAVEVLRDGYNGFLAPADDAGILAAALVAIHHYLDQLSEWGARSQQLAAPYAAEIWAGRWRDLLLRLSDTGTRKDAGH
ncbi:MAG: glycosyltransferase family 4 protein [Caldilineaceae bacterium]|nr:glycosyltransferase family 4 protein [Caldilineaceae bacterium]